MKSQSLDKAAPFQWNGVEIRTMGQTMDAAIVAMRDGDAAQFKAAYIAHCGGTPEAERIVNANLGYMGGYYDADTNAEIQAAYGCVHPIFGATIPTPEEAFEMGKEAGAKTKDLPA